MTTRKRKTTARSSESTRRNRRQSKLDQKRVSRRQHLLETLEPRQLLAGPQLIGIQPNEGALIVDGTERDTAPRVLTFGFDEVQQIDPTTLDGIRITRAGTDDQFGTDDDVQIQPGLVTVGDPNQNEVVVRFVEALPDDKYRIEVFGFDDDGRGITGLQNVDGEFFVPSDGARTEVINFDLNLGALIESVVPQPVIRVDDGDGGSRLVQNRNEIVVYFNEDTLFVENDANGNPTERSAENPRFYQLLFTQETVRTTDDHMVMPTRVVYDPVTNTSRLFFDDDINNLARDAQGNEVVGGGTWRLRVGTAVDDMVDLVVTPTPKPVQRSTVADFQHPGLRVTFRTLATGELSGGTSSVRFIDSGTNGLTASLDVNNDVVFDFGGETPQVSDLQAAIAADLGVVGAIEMLFSLDGVQGQGGSLIVPQSVLGAAPMPLVAVGETLETAFDVGVFGQFNELTSVVLQEAISPQPYLFELPGGQDDPGHTSAVNHINDRFGADTLFGVTEIAYNFQPEFDNDPNDGTPFLNQITDIQKIRIREALSLWASEIGVQFRETQDEGITFALGDTSNLQSRPLLPVSDEPILNASIRIDPDFADPAMVFSNQVVYGTNYGEDFTRKAVAGIGLLLGLNQSSDLAAPSIMSFDGGYLNASIDSLTDLEPVFPNNVDVLHGQHVHRNDSVDVDLYRFEVNLNDPDKVGTLTAETFAERLPDSSLLDTTLTLFQEVNASVTTDFGIGTDVSVKIEAMVPGRIGNNSRLEFRPTARTPGDRAVRILPSFDSTGAQLANAIIVDMPRPSTGVTVATVDEVVTAINASPLSSSIFRASLEFGDGATEITDTEAMFSPLFLTGGGVEQLSRNDDYFSEDSRVVASLGEGVYYVGVAASGNDQYDPTIAGSSAGGRTQGAYELQLQFEPQVDEVDVIRDQDSDRLFVPGTVLDGDGDGVPGGAFNFWFQTRALNRVVEFTDDGDAVVPGQTVTVVGANGVIRTFEFVLNGTQPSPGNIAVTYSGGGFGFPTPSGNLASLLQSRINAVSAETGVTVQRSGASLEFFGERSVNFSTGFRGATAYGRNIFVDKTAGPQADGSLDNPFNNIANPVVANAFGSAIENDIVRIVGNGGLDTDLTTPEDNLSYQIGVTDTGGTTLEDGRNMEVPHGVTTMIDAGAVFKLRNSFIGIGSSTVQVDRSGGALQVLGTPRLVDLSQHGPLDVNDPAFNPTTTLVGNANVDAPGYDDGSVIFTSIRDTQADAAAAFANGPSQIASPGNWGGLIFRRDIDEAQGRRDLEDEGIFLQRVNHAELRYGGGSGVLIDSVQQLVNPIQIVNMRPTITFNDITQSADSAISAAPDSFEETSYQAPVFQQAGAFRADYERIGPEIHNNQLVDNSINGLFIRATTTPTERPKEFTIAGRLDDIDVVHYVSENLVVAANPGGSVSDGFAPSLNLVSAQVLAGGDLAAATYQYKMTFVDRDGFESLASPDGNNDTFQITVADAGSSVELTSLPQVAPESEYVSRRLYRSVAGANDFRLVADLDGSSIGHIDDGTTGEAQLDLSRAGVRGRLDASLVMDPGLIVKFRGARIELGHGTQLLAEGIGSSLVVLTSSQDDRFGAGGTFDTNNDNETITGAAVPQRGDWSGIYASPTSYVSFDNVQLSYAGGISLLEGGLARGFLPLELQQANARITNSSFEFNDSGQDGAGPAGRLGRLAVTPATILVRGAQPVIVGNTFVDNRGSIIDIDIESMRGNYRIDAGRQTGDIDRISELDDNFGPMIRFNRYLNDPTSGSQLSGLEVRAGVIAAETVFDDTDIAHLLFDNIEVGNFHSSGSLRLLSRPDESLVVKFAGSGSPNSETWGTGITATGTRTGIDDRIGGSVHVIGLPGAPVILTSLNDDDAGAGFKPDGSQFTDHDGDGIVGRPFANDWRGLLFQQFSNDTNVAILPELELSTEAAPGLNGGVENAQFLGELAKDELTSDHVRRLGFEVHGFLADNNDVDVYSFIGSPGSEVWIDIDRTSLGLDTVIELLDENGTVLARSDNSFDETALTSPTPVTVLDPDLEGLTTSLLAQNEQYTERGADLVGVGGLYEDFGSTNPYDAGIHYRLAGNQSDPNLRSVYFFRVRSNSVNPDDAQGGITGGGYRFQARLREAQEFPGSVVRYADIRYANHGIHVQGLMATSPLLGEAQENEAAVEVRDSVSAFGVALNDPSWADNDTPVGINVGQGGQFIGNLVNNSNNVIGVGGSLSSGNDVDFYQFDVDFAGSGVQSTIFDIDYAAGFNRPDTNISVFYGGEGVNARDVSRLVYFGSSSNIADDLTSPNGENSPIEKLVRGSVSTADPYIGPVTLAEGSYYVAVTADGIEPVALQGAVRETVNSVVRIVEDRVDRINPEMDSVSGGPIHRQIFTDAIIGASPFSVEVDPAIGHGKPDHVDGTSGIPTFGGAVVYDESVIANGLDADNDVLPGILFGANLDQQDWSLDDDINIGGNRDFLNGGSEFTATTIPHISVNGSLANDPADIYQFSITGVASQRVIIDIDGGYNAFGEFDDDGDITTPPINLDQSSVDTTLVLLQEDTANPGTLNVIQTDTDDFLFGFSTGNEGREGSNSGLDPYISTFLGPGNYFIAVLEATTTFTNDANGFITSNANISANAQTYTLHVSVEDHVLPPGNFLTNSGEEVLAFDRIANDVSGTVTSAPFDLAGYVAEDLPTLYFNQIFEPVTGGFGLDDSASMTIVSDQNPAGTLVHTFAASNAWSQIRLPLDEFAGHTGIRLQLEYLTNGLQASQGPNSTETGLRIDDIIVGFAERGETIFGASSNPTFVGTGFGAVSGEYQLEIRRGTEYAVPQFGGTTLLTESFDTNERHNRSVTLDVPDGSMINAGDTFVIGDGAANQTFQFVLNIGDADFGNTPVVFAPTDTAAAVAQNLRSAINSQTSIQIEASSASGLDTQPMTSGRLVLSGSATGTFDDDPAVQFTTNSDGHVILPAVLNDGIGDENFLRRQGQVIVEHNVIRDVRGIGIWSEPGERDISPHHVFPNQFIDAAPLGNSYPGAVRNLPTLNDSVLGGLAPGIVIRNNVIDQAEYAGIKLDGQVATWGIVPTNGSNITDGTTFAIDAAGTRVVFEFEDIGDGAVATPRPPLYGSDAEGGDGVRDGHVPVYYRWIDEDTPFYLNRADEYTPVEVAHAIHQAIQGSILVTNGLVELVDPIVGASLIHPASDDGFGFGFFNSGLNFSEPAVYIQGASLVIDDPFAPTGTGFTDFGGQIFQAPIYEAPQPFARVVNNTIYGDDGTESAFPENADNEPNDFLESAIETNLGSSHRGAYRQTSVTLGNNSGPLAGAGDVDFYKVFLEVGDRLIADVDTADEDAAQGIPEGPDTFLRVFDAQGVEHAFNDNALVPDYLETLSTASAQVSDDVNVRVNPNTQNPEPLQRDPFVDFTAPKTGVYYVGVSSVGNEIYDPSSLSERQIGDGGSGDYTVSLEVLAPRSHVISINNGSGATRNRDEGDQGGTVAGDIFGSRIIVTLVQDVDPSRTWFRQDQPNQVHFTISQANGFGVRISGPQTDRIVEILMPAESRLPDIMGAIGDVLSGNFGGLTILENGGPIPRVYAAGAGGPDAGGAGLDDNFFLFGPDFNSGGFLVETRDEIRFDSCGPEENVQQCGEPYVEGATGHRQRFGTTEQYVLVEKVARIELDQTAVDNNIKLDPLPGKDTDQLINEAGIVIAGGASPTLLNNVFLNLHESVYGEVTRVDGFSPNRGTNLHPKQHPDESEVIVVGSVFQHDEQDITQFNQDMIFAGRFDTGITTVQPSNINGGTDDFNVTLANDDPAVQYAEASNFQPDFSSILIDSSVSSLVDRTELVNLRNAVGLPISNILTPALDVSGVVRADNPDFAPPGGIGASVFIDRGATELADFTGPVAIAETPRDDDADGVDSDPNITFIDLTDGIYENFQIQLRDNGDSSDPFTGIGIDDSTVVVPVIDGIRASGANVTLFENERALVEGIDYTFNYDETKNVITLTPLSGIWQNGNAYRIALNNRDQTVLIASNPSEIRDGDQFSITDSLGGTVVFEYETGFQLQFPDPLTLVVPPQGTDAGGVRDGDIFQIDDGFNPPVVFEYNADSAKLPDTYEITLPIQQANESLDDFLGRIASNTADAIAEVVDPVITPDLNLDLDVVVDTVRNRVVLGAEAGATVSTVGTGLLQLANTLALQVPALGVDPSGVVAGDTFTVDNGIASVVFEFVDGNAPTGTNVGVDIANAVPLTADEVANRIQLALLGSGLRLESRVDGPFVYLGLPDNGDAISNVGNLRVIGLSRTPVDGTLITFSPDNGSSDVIFELNRTDEPGVVADPLLGTEDGNDNVAIGHFPINYNRATTAFGLAGATANAVGAQTISGLPQSDPPGSAFQNDEGLLTVGGTPTLGLGVSPSSIEVVGSPTVTGASTIQVFGPLLLNMPAVGGGGIRSGDVIIMNDDLGNEVLFEFVLAQPGFAPFFDGTPDANGDPKPVSVVVPYNSFDTDDVLGASLANVINGANIGITATSIGGGQVSVGRIDGSRVNTRGDLDRNIPGTAQITTQRGIVSDQEVLVIRQGTTQLSLEFEEASNGNGVAPGNIAVSFQAGSSVGNVAQSLAAAINNNANNLRVNAVAELDADGNPTGQVILEDIPGTVVDVSAAPTLNVVGVPGGAIPVTISPSFGATQVKQAMLLALNSINTPGEAPATTLSASDRGGNTLFVENGTIFLGTGISTYFLPAIKDLAGNPIEANRGDTTQFTILMPDTALDFGDAPDPFFDSDGRYPTTLVHDGPRHVADPTLTLGATIDVDLDGRPVANADGDDNVVIVTSNSPIVAITPTTQGAVEIFVDTALASPASIDGSVITIDSGIDQTILEFDTDGLNIFNEDHFAIRPQSPVTSESIAEAIVAAIGESPLRLASVGISGSTVALSVDDEDGVVLTSDLNPTGVLNKSTTLPITVSVQGDGILDGWIDFNADGDWDDPGEQIISRSTPGAIFSDQGVPVPVTFDIRVPDVTPTPPGAITTYARFRVSREGGLTPSGLAFSGEVEDYAILLVPGAPPELSDAQANRTYTVPEGVPLQVLDENGALTPTISNDDGLLANVTDPQGQGVAIYGEDVGFETLVTPNNTVGGILNVASDGTFTFTPEPFFFGDLTFTKRVTDLDPSNPAAQLVSTREITATISVQPVNDPPELIDTLQDVVITRQVNEDNEDDFGNPLSPIIFELDELTENFAPGRTTVPFPLNEADQLLRIQSASSFPDNVGVTLNGVSTLGGSVEVINSGTQIRYTPPADYFGDVPDTFLFVVADVPPAGQLVQAAETKGTVSITIDAVNDPPIAELDTYSTGEVDDGNDAGTLIIPLTGTLTGSNGNTLEGILENDAVGPVNEGTQLPTLVDPETQFPIVNPTMTQPGGSVVYDAASQTLRYTPPAFFSGIDRFTYTITDNHPQSPRTAVGTVLIQVDGRNDAPRFIGIEGDIDVQSIEVDESKETPVSVTYDLNTWFVDPESDDLAFTVVSADESIASVQLTENVLEVTYPSFAFGETRLTVTADDGTAPPTTLLIPVTVNNTEDPPTLISRDSDVLLGDEDESELVDLRTVFFDPDGEQLNFRLSRLGNLFNPSQSQIDDHPLIQSVSTNGDTLIIVPKANQFSETDALGNFIPTEIEVTATDRTNQQVTDLFEVVFQPAPDNPIAVGDSYSVPIGSQIQVLNPRDGVLANDADADGDTIAVDQFTTPSFGTLDLNDNGTFTYVNTSGAVGVVDSFTYSPIDATGRTGAPVVVSLTLGQSRYQNPIRQFDVNADGNISPVDALIVINYVAANGVFTPVNEIGTPPPDFLDVDGNGNVQPSDALAVIDYLSDRARSRGELVVAGPSAQGEQIDLSARFAVTTAFASPTSDFLPAKNVSRADTQVVSEPTVVRDELLSRGLAITSSPAESAADGLALSSLPTTDAENSESFDEAILDLLGDRSSGLLD